VVPGAIFGGIEWKSSQGRGALQHWTPELALAALVRLDAWLQSCADRGRETF